MNIKVDGDKLVITVDISPKAMKAAKPSKSGKTRVIASTNGFQKLDSGRENISVGLNVICK